MNLKNKILDKISELDIFYKYIGQEIPFGKTIISPIRHEKVPSFNIYQASNGSVYFKDFSGERGDCFKLVMLLYNCTFREALQIIADDFNIQSDSAGANRGRQSEQMRNVIRIPSIVKRERTRLDVVKKDWDLESLSFWAQWNIGRFQLDEYNVYPCESFTMNRRNGEGEFTIEWTEEDPIFCYEINDAKKIYRPYHQNKPFKFLSNTRGSDIFGLSQINNKQKLLIICAGQKDCLSLYCNTGIRGIALNSESAHLTKQQYLEIVSLTDKLLICYDNDKTGTKNALKLSNAYSLDRVDLSTIDTNPVDISDLCEVGNKKKEDFINIIKNYAYTDKINIP